MKKVLLFTAICIVFVSSCDKNTFELPETPKNEQGQEQKEPDKENEKEFSPIGMWQTTRQQLTITVDGPDVIKEMHELNTSVDVSDDESYRLSFHEDEHGFGSGARHDAGRYNFTFDWELSDGVLSLTETNDKDPYGGVFNGGVFMRYTGVWEEIDWQVEEFSDDMMILSMEEFVWVDGSLPDGTPVPWCETRIYRYSFKRVE